MTPDLLIDDVLADLGYRSEDARRVGRAALEQARLTNGRKARIAASKHDAIRSVLAGLHILVCTRAACRAAATAAAKTLIDAARPTDCSICGGSQNRAAIDGAIAVLTSRGVRRIVVVGGSPGTHDELRTLVGDRLDLRIVPGTDRRTSREANFDLAWADVVVVWGGTELSHSVSKLYTDRRVPHVITCPRRGITALGATLVESQSSTFEATGGR